MAKEIKIRKEDAPIESRDTKSNIAQKLLALGDEIVTFHADPDRFKKQYTPYNIELLAPPGNCQQKCSYCSAAFMRDEYSKIVKSLGCDLDTSIDLSLLKLILDEITKIGTRAVVFTGGGDWSPYNWFPDAVAYANKKGLSVGIASHFAATKFDKEGLEKIIANSDWVRVSLDGYDKGSYEKIRNPENSTNDDQYKNMMHNIKLMAEIRKTLKEGSNATTEKVKQQEFGAQMVVCRENYFWVPAVVKCAEAMGVDYLQVRPIELRGDFESVDGITKDFGQHRYADKYEGFWQLEIAAKLCELMENHSAIDTLFRWDKVNIIYRDGSFTTKPKEAFKNCVGSHFSGKIGVSRPLIISQCYWRYDLAMAFDIEKNLLISKNEDGILSQKNCTLGDVFFSEERSRLYERADKSRKKCSNLCKYAVINPVWEQQFSRMSKDEFTKLVQGLAERIQDGEVKISCPYHL